MRGSTRNSIGGMPIVVQRVDLLGHLHRAELRREGRAGAAGHDDAGHHAPISRTMAIATRSAT